MENEITEKKFWQDMAEQCKWEKELCLEHGDTIVVVRKIIEGCKEKECSLCRTTPVYGWIYYMMRFFFQHMVEQVSLEDFMKNNDHSQRFLNQRYKIV